MISFGICDINHIVQTNNIPSENQLESGELYLSGKRCTRQSKSWAAGGSVGGWRPGVAGLRITWNATYGVGPGALLDEVRVLDLNLQQQLLEDKGVDKRVLTYIRERVRSAGLFHHHISCFCFKNCRAFCSAGFSSKVYTDIDIFCVFRCCVPRSHRPPGMCSFFGDFRDETSSK